MKIKIIFLTLSDFSVSAPFSINSVSTFVCPFPAAQISGVYPFYKERENIGKVEIKDEKDKNDAEKYKQ